jgi:hypothetical protein
MASPMSLTSRPDLHSNDKTSSPSHSNTTSPPRATPLSFADFQLSPDSTDRPRLQSFSTLRGPSPEPAPGSITYALSGSSSSEPPTLEYSQVLLRYRSHSHSPARRDRSPDLKHNAVARLRNSESAINPNVQSQSWWSSRESLPKSRNSSPRGRKSLSPEYDDRWLSTRQVSLSLSLSIYIYIYPLSSFMITTHVLLSWIKKVSNAAASVLGVSGDLTHEALLLASDVLKFAPIFGLEAAAHALLSIWDAVQLVDV